MSSNEDASASTYYWRRRYEEADARLNALEADLAAVTEDLNDEQHTHSLRDIADSVRKREIEELAAGVQRSTVDVDYLKNVVRLFYVDDRNLF